LMGPGKRWMDYRCDTAPTLQRLVQLIATVRQAVELTPALARKLGVTHEEVQELEQVLDGSLSLRLLLESISPQPGETQHHLLAANYLKKKEGQHGDWLSRMDPSKPSKTMVSHMGKDTYAYVHPTRPRTLSVREAARIQTFPDSYRLRSVGLVDGFRIIGNAVPPLLSAQFAERIAQVLWLAEERAPVHPEITASAIRPMRHANTGV
jgi:site-specific DNA-cytosine methylase